MRFRLRTPLIVLAIGPPLCAALYLAPGETFAFLFIAGGGAFTFVRREYESWKSAMAPLRKRLEELEAELEK